MTLIRLVKFEREYDVANHVPETVGAKETLGAAGHDIKRNDYQKSAQIPVGISILFFSTIHLNSFTPAG